MTTPQLARRQPDRLSAYEGWIANTAFPGIEDAACRFVDPELFFPRSKRDLERRANQSRAVTKAKKVCAGCPVTSACLGAALARREHLGIWGGTTPAERRRLLRDMVSMRRNVSSHIRRIQAGTRIPLGPADSLAVVFYLCEHDWTFDDVGKALGLTPASAAASYLRACAAVRARDALTAHLAADRAAV